MTTIHQPSAAGAPSADWVDMGEMLRDPYDTYRRLREAAPVGWTPILNRYMATTYAGCRVIEANQETFTADARTALTARAPRRWKVLTCRSGPPSA